MDEVELIEANPQYALVRHADGRESNVSIRDLALARDVPGPWIAPEDRPTPPDSEAPLEDHGTEIAPDTSSNDTVSNEAPLDTSDGPTPESLTAQKKRVHPKTDSDVERPTPLRRKHFRARYFRAHRQACTDEPPCLSTPTTNHGLPRWPLRARKVPRHLRDFLPYQ